MLTEGMVQFVRQLLKRRHCEFVTVKGYTSTFSYAAVYHALKIRNYEFMIIAVS